MSEEKGDEFRREGYKRLQFRLATDELKNDASTVFEKAANQYKLAECYGKAADAYIEAAQAYPKNYKQAGYYSNASSMHLKNKDTIQAKSSIRSAIEIYLEIGNILTAAKSYETLGEILQGENNLLDAILAYENACKYYELENSPFSGCILTKAAYLCIDCFDYGKAITLLDKIANQYVNTIASSKCKSLFFDAMILRLNFTDIKTCREVLEKYCNIGNLNFCNTREYAMINVCIEASESQNECKFLEAVAEYESLQPLNSWQKTLLSEIKDYINDMNNS